MKTFKKGMAILVMAMIVICTTGFVLNDIAGGSQDKGNGSLNGHDYVDLGLPSGTLWATCNVGASKPEGYGYYYAWGETSTKSTYNWYTYKYAKGNNDKLTKYCYSSHYGNEGFTDNLTVLQPRNDAATANWGNGWCMPTADQWRELLDNTNIAWTTQNSVKGRLLTAPNGNSIFLPAAGHHYSGEIHNVGSNGYYWSSSLYTRPDGAWIFDFGSEGHIMYYDYRDMGLSVRPVRSASK